VGASPLRELARPAWLIWALVGLGLGLLVLALGYFSALRYASIFGGADQLIGLCQRSSAALDQLDAVASGPARLTRITDESIAPVIADVGKTLAIARQAGTGWDGLAERGAMMQSTLEQLARYQRDWNKVGEDLSQAQRALARACVSQLREQVQWIRVNARDDVQRGLTGMLLGVMAVVLAGAITLIAGAAVALLAVRTARSVARTQAEPSVQGIRPAAHVDIAPGPTNPPGSAGPSRALVLAEDAQLMAALAAGFGHDAGNTALVLDATIDPSAPRPLRAAADAHRAWTLTLAELGQAFSGQGPPGKTAPAAPQPTMDLSAWLARTVPVGAKTLPRSVRVALGSIQPGVVVRATPDALGRVLLTLLAALRKGGQLDNAAKDSQDRNGLDLVVTLTSGGSVERGGALQRPTTTVEVAIRQSPAPVDAAALTPWLEAAGAALAGELGSLGATLDLPAGQADRTLALLTLPAQTPTLATPAGRATVAPAAPETPPSTATLRTPATGAPSPLPPPLPSPPQPAPPQPPPLTSPQPAPLPPLPALPPLAPLSALTPLVPLTPLAPAPALAPAFVAGPAPANQQPAASRASPSVVLVSDQALAAAIIAQWLGESGCRVTLARSGTEALRVLAAGPGFDAIVTELDLPGLDGVSLLRKLGSASGPAAGATLPPQHRVALSTERDDRLPPDLEDAGVRLLVRPLRREDISAVAAAFLEKVV
jgi:CheY-like chemotaxis protein